MDPNAILPLMTTVIGVVFFIMLADQHIARPRAHKAVWACGLLIFSIGVFTQFWGVAYGWNELIYKLWYWCGAIAVAAWLGAGSVYLLARGHWPGHVFLGLVVALSAAGAVILLANSVPADHVYPGPSQIVRGDGIPEAARRIAALSNIIGTLALVGVAGWGAWRYFTSRVTWHRAVSNVLIAGGAFVVAAGGALSRFEVTAPFYLTQLLGLGLIFSGFLVSVEVFAHFRLPFTARRSLRPGASDRRP